MKIKITDIPPQGRELKFELESTRLNERVAAAGDKATPAAVATPTYRFSPKPLVDMKLNLEGTTVVVSGKARGTFTTECSRCAEDTTKPVDIKLDMILKPRTARGPAAAGDEDISFGFYDEQEIDCSGITEELLILALPYSVPCSDGCKGLCPHCGVNLNSGACSCKQDEPKDDRFGILRQLKVH